MPSITLRNLDAGTKSRLRVRAAQHGRSMEAEAKEILRAALNEKRRPAKNLADAIHARFARLGGVELPLAPREPMQPPIEF